METKRFLYLHSVKTFSDNLSVRVVTIRNVKIIPDFNFIAGLKLRIPQILKQEDTYVDISHIILKTPINISHRRLDVCHLGGCCKPHMIIGDLFKNSGKVEQKHGISNHNQYASHNNFKSAYELSSFQYVIYQIFISGRICF